MVKKRARWSDGESSEVVTPQVHKILNMAFASFEPYDEQEEVEQWLEDFKALMFYAESTITEETGENYKFSDKRKKFKILQYIKRSTLSKLRATMKNTDIDVIQFEEICDALKRTFGHHFLQSNVLTSLIEISKRDLKFSEAVEVVSTTARKLENKFLTKENLKIILVLMTADLPQELKDKYLGEICAEKPRICSLTDLDKMVKMETHNSSKYNQSISINATKTDNHKWKRQGKFNSNEKCSKCNRRGHSSTSCSAKTKIIPIHVVSNIDENKDCDYYKFRNFSSKNKYININKSGLFIDLYVVMKTGEKKITLEFDTAAQATIIDDKTARELNLKLEPTSMMIKGVSGTKVPCLGKCKINIKNIKGETPHKTIEVFIADIQSNILGLPEIKLLKLDELSLKEIDNLIPIKKTGKELDTAKEKFSKLIETKFSKLFDSTTTGEFPESVDLQFIDKPKWRHVPVRPYPPGITNECVQTKIDEMVSNGIWKKVSYCDASSPVKPVIKKLDKVNIENGLVEPDNTRLTADFSLLNSNLKTNVYPIKNISTELSKVGLRIKGKSNLTISVFDVKAAYDSIPINMSSSLKCGITTHSGTYIPLRLPQGISQAPGIWQQKMDKIILEVEIECQFAIEKFSSVIIAYYDDVIIISPDADEHLKVLNIFCSHMQEKNLRFQKEKVKCFVESVVILGHLISNRGIQPDPSKLEKLCKLPIPKSSSEMKSYIGCLTYQQGFVMNLAEYKAKLEKFIKVKPYTITEQLEKDFQQSKDILMKYCINNFYNGQDKLILDCDASDTSMGFVLYSLTDGREMIIALNSRKFTPCETKLAIQVKECLAIYYGVKKFHQYLTGKRFKIRSDHRTLSLIFKEGADIKKSTNRRIQRIQLELLEYVFDVEYRKGTEIGLVDTISRANFENISNEIKMRKKEMLEDTTDIYQISTLQEVQNIISATTFFSNEEFDEAIENDKEYSLLLQHLINNTPCPKEFKKVEEFLGLEGKYAIMGDRRIIPYKLRNKCLDLLHITHDGEKSMLINARNNIFWPRMRSDIKFYCLQCKQCEEYRRARIIPVKQWKQPTKPFQRIHVDIAMFLDSYVIVCQDVYSGMAFMDNFDKHGINQVTEFFMNIFRSFGFPEEIVSDGGKELVQFGKTCSQWGIKYTSTPVEHQSSNGQAERLVQTVKYKLLKMGTTKQSLKENLFLIQTLHQSTKKGNRNLSPYNIIFTYSPKTVIELQLKKVDKTITDDIDKSEVNNQFKIGDMVWFRKNQKGKWSKGTIEELHGSRVVTVKPDMESTYKSNIKLHQDCIKKRTLTIM